MHRRLKVLVAAYACSPRRGSEAGVGWGWIQAMSVYHDLWVITGDEEPFPDGIYRYKEEIEEELDRRPDLRSRITFHYIHKPRWMSLERVWPPSYLWFYRRWLRQAYGLALQLHAEHKFDLVHQLTYVGYRVPGHLWMMDVPFVWGPVGGLENTPWRMLPALGLRGCLYFLGRNAVNSLQRLLLGAPRKAMRRTPGGVIAATSGIQQAIRGYYGVESKVICEIGIPPVSAYKPTERHAGQPLRLVWSGQHIPGKALQFLLRALAQLPKHVAWHLDILGRGACTSSWCRLADRLGIGRQCIWHGHLDRQKALLCMQQAHALVITSVSDLTSTVLVEALTQGLPVICPDLFGFRDAVSRECGIRVPMLRPRQFVSDLAVSIARLAEDEALRRRMACQAMLRAQDYTWELKAEAVNEVYCRVCPETSSRREASALPMAAAKPEAW